MILKYLEKNFNFNWMPYLLLNGVLCRMMDRIMGRILVL